MKNTPTYFEVQLLQAIRNRIRAIKQDGTVSMSVENLMQITPPPSHSVAGAPQGTNARYFYAEIFRSLCRQITNFPITNL